MNFLWLALLCPLVLAAVDSKSDHVDHKDKSGVGDSKGILEGADVKAYQVLFREARRHQSESIRTLKNVPLSADRTRLVKETVNKLITVTSKARSIIESEKFELKRHNLPSAQPLKDAVSKVLENSAFFAEATLHFPKQFNKLYSVNFSLKDLANWGFDFCDKIDLLDDDSKVIVDLAKQELGIVEKKPDFQNPFFKSKEQQQQEVYDDLKEKEALKKAKKDSKKPNKDKKHSEL